MSTLNLMQLAFGLKALGIIVGGVLVNYFEKYLPLVFTKLVRYGKYACKSKNRYVDKWEVPKRWFRHFYVFAGPYSTCALALLHYRYFLHEQLPHVIVVFLKIFLSKESVGIVAPENVILATAIFSIHCWKRFYETNYVNVFSNVYMNVTVYLVGLFHYFGAMISIVGESYGLTESQKIYLDWTRLTFVDYAFTVIFLISTYTQYRTNLTLANLRKDKTGAVISKKYKIPYGGLFDYITSPLQFTEITLYLCLSGILRQATTFHYVTIWVIANQLECAHLAHDWSLKHFSNYPKDRNIIIPGIY